MADVSPVPEGIIRRGGIPSAVKRQDEGRTIMDATQLDAIAKAAATEVGRRQVLRGLLATAGGGILVHRTSDESAARNRCCRRQKRLAKQDCFNFTEGDCPRVTNFSCEKTGPGTCEVISFNCENKAGVRCVR